MVVKAPNRVNTKQAPPWFPSSGGFVQPQVFRLADADWLAFSQHVMPWDVERILGVFWEISDLEEFSAALEADRG